ncbi:MAG: hypothetical protein SX243_04795 [Acidobacteriota bacterium]|nr:hypothetical protein [Acidobacteriota bacterium]
MNRSVILFFSILLLATILAPPAAAQGTSISVEVEAPGCLPIAENGVVTAQVQNEPAGSSVRIYFRRLHQEVEDFYYVLASPDGPGTYRAVLPEAEDEELEEKQLETSAAAEDGSEDDWADWWKAKEESTNRDPNDDLNRDLIDERAQQGRLERRDWMLAMTDEELQDWLAQQENEPTEYFGEVIDANGQLVAQSEMEVVEVRDNCQFPLTPRQEGEAENLVVGETAEWEEGEEPFHWLCDGIVSRIDPQGVLRVDRHCRFCVIAWWQRKEVLIPAAAAAVATGVIIADNDDEPASPSAP